MLQIDNLTVEIEGKEIIKDLNLKLEKGKVYALMGPNGSGKSTLAGVLMGNPKYKVLSGRIIFNNKDITNISPNERAKEGLFLSFQYPREISGVTMFSFLRTAYNSIHKKLSVLDFRKLLDEKAKILGFDNRFYDRYLNQGFSGGEKKKAEIVQMMVLNPNLAILDETDSGLDIDSLKDVAKGINSFVNKDKCVLIITHYKRILEYIKPDKVIILSKGVVVKEGSGEIVDKLEEEGYGWVNKEF